MLRSEVTNKAITATRAKPRCIVFHREIMRGPRLTSGKLQVNEGRRYPVRRCGVQRSRGQAHQPERPCGLRRAFRKPMRLASGAGQ